MKNISGKKISIFGRVCRRFFVAGKIFCGKIILVMTLKDFEVGEYIFEWDDEKAEINKRKHKVMFSIAAKVFLDDYRIEDYDELHSDDEERRKVIGRVGKVLVVIYTERGENIRIISARTANKKEQEDYYGQFSSL